MSKYANHPLFNYMIDELLDKLIHFGIGLEEYFASNLPFFEIEWEAYPSLHHDLSYLVKPVNEEYISSLKDAHDKIFGSDLKPSEESSALFPISYYLVNLPFTMTNDP